MNWFEKLIKDILAAIFKQPTGDIHEKDSKEKVDKDKTSQEVRHPQFKEIAAYIEELITKGTNNPFTKTPYKDFRESQGKNRSKELDALIIRNGGKLADPYCLYGLQDILRAVEIKFKIKFDLPKTGSTQSFFNRVNSIYKTSEPLPYAIGIYQKGDEYKGHAVLCLSKIDAEDFSTFEFNTSPEQGKIVERDGQGCYFKTRSVEGYDDMRLRGFVDIFKAIK